MKPRRYARTGARQLGTRVHGALEVYYTSGEGAAGRDIALGALEYLRDLEIIEAGEDTGLIEEIEKEHELAAVMFRGYYDWLAEEGADSDLRVVAAETVMRVPSPVPGVDLVGKLDLEVERISTGEHGIVDHKTVGGFADRIKMSHLDEQFRQYALMKRLAEPQSPGLSFRMLNMLKKSKRTARAAPPFFMRHEVYINDSELRAFWERLHGEITDIVDFERRILEHPENHRSIAYPNPQDSCSWKCDFWTVCPLLDDDHADPEYLLSENFVVGDPHSHYDGRLSDVPVA